MYEYFRGDQIYGDDWPIPEEYMDERWWFINGIPEYMISDCGRVWSIKNQMFLKPKRMDRHGHLGVCLRVDNMSKYVYIHRLMAEAFIPNTYNEPIVRHLNDDPTDNMLNNLRWGTQKDNMRDCNDNGHTHFVTSEEREIGLSKIRKPIIAIRIDTGERLTFRGQTEAARLLHVQQANIWKVLNGIRDSTCGYYFEYVQDGVRYGND